MKTKVRVEHVQRYDGKFNVWRKADIHFDEGPIANYGDWVIIDVCKTEDDARRASGKG